LNATSKLVKAWESRNAKNAAKAGGISMMALSLAACGGSSTTTATDSTASDNTTTTADAAQTFASVAGLDAFVGGSGDDSVSASNTTLNAGDSFTGGEGSDTLAIFTSAGVTVGGFSTTDVETISVSATGGAAVVNLGNVAGETTLRVTGSDQNVTFNTADTISTLALQYNSAGNATVTYNAATVVGTADAMTVSTTDTVAGTVTLAGIETLTVANAGTSTVAALTTTSATSVAVTGSGTLTLTDLDDVTTSVDASAYTGALTSNGFGAVDVTYAGGSGVDTINFSGLDDGDSIDGGAGTADVLSLTMASNVIATSTVAGDITVSNVEILDIVSDDNGDAVDFDIFSAPAFDTVRVTITADADDVTLTDTQSSKFHLRNTDNVSVSDNVDFLTIDLKDSSGTSAATTTAADSIALTIQNRDTTEAMTVSTITGAGIEDLDLTANVSEASGTGVEGDIAVTNFTFAALETIDVAGDADLTLGTFGTNLTDFNGAASTGDLSVTFAAGDITATGGSGADTFAFGTTFTEDDSVSGGAGTDTVTVGAINDGAVLNIDMNLTDVERFTFTETSASDSAITFDFNGTSVDRVTVTAQAGSDDVILFDDVGGSDLDLYVLGSGEADGDTIQVNLQTDGTADTLDVFYTITTAAIAFEGTYTLNDFETINFDTTAATTADPITIADIDATDATSVVFTNDDAWDAADIFTLTATSIKTGATIDFTGYNQSIGDAVALADVAGADGTSSTTGKVADLATIMGTAGFTAVAGNVYTIKLGDGRTENADVETVINLGASNTGLDVIEMVDGAEDTTDDIGVVVINNFNDAANSTAANRTKLDVSSFGIDSVSDMTFTGGEADDAADLTVISSTEFAGTITLLGVVSTDLSASDFILA